VKKIKNVAKFKIDRDYLLDLFVNKAIEKLPNYSGVCDAAWSGLVDICEQRSLYRIDSLNTDDLYLLEELIEKVSFNLFSYNFDLGLEPTNPRATSVHWLGEPHKDKAIRETALLNIKEFIFKYKLHYLIELRADDVESLASRVLSNKGRRKSFQIANKKVLI